MYSVYNVAEPILLGVMADYDVYIFIIGNEFGPNILLIPLSKLIIQVTFNHQSKLDVVTVPPIPFISNPILFVYNRFCTYVGIWTRIFSFPVTGVAVDNPVAEFPTTSIQSE